MISYFIKFTICLGMLLAFYHLVLEKEKMHTFNRFYLLGSVLFSLLVPFAILYVEPAPVILNEFSAMPSVNNFTSNVTLPATENTVQIWTVENIMVGVYFIGLLLLSIRFIKNLAGIISVIQKNKQKKINKAILVLVEEKILPHSFWNFIFVNRSEFENNNLENELFTHEITHVTQKHTFDVLLIELLQIVLWFNPFLFLIKKAIQLNHEYLADDSVIKSHKNIFRYQTLLLDKATWNNKYYLASNLNYLVTKKRLKMMTKKTHKYCWLKQLAIAPLLVGLFFVFADRVEAQQKEDSKVKVETIVEDVTYVEDTNLHESELYKEFVNRRGYFFFKDKNGKEISKKYNELSAEEKKRIVPPPPLKRSKKPIQKELYNKLKNKEKYAVWIDGKVTENSELNKYKYNDFASHSVSFVYNNARSKRFPQEYQARLQTEAYFNKLNKKRAEEFIAFLKKEKGLIEVKKLNKTKQTKSKSSSKKDTSKVKFHKDWYITIDGEKYYYTFDKNERIARYYKNGKLVDLDIVEEYKKKNKYFEALKNTGKHYVFKSKEEQQLIEREFSDLGGMYFRMPRADKNKVKRPKNPVNPYVRLRKDGKVWYKKKEDLTDEEKLLLPPDPPRANASETQKEKYKKVLKEWIERTNSNSYNLPSSNGSKNNIINKPLLKNVVVNKKVFIIIDNDTFKISYDSTFKNIVSISFEQIEKMISDLSDNQIKNTFIFSKTNDFKKFRKLPSSAEEYKDDLEIFIVKSDYEIITLKNENGKKNEFPKFHMALDNKDKINYESKVSQLAELFKKYNIKNLTI